MPSERKARGIFPTGVGVDGVWHPPNDNSLKVFSKFNYSVRLSPVRNSKNFEEKRQ